IRLVESGPAAGALVAAYLGDLMGRQDLIAFDMGGTTAKLCLITNGRPGQTNSFEVARVQRFMLGSGLPIQVPAIELIEIGARGIFEVVTENMLAATKVHVAERGHDPRGYALVAFGGAGPVHAYALARALKLREIVCPRGAGVASALGFLTAPVAFELARSVL